MNRHDSIGGSRYRVGLVVACLIGIVLLALPVAAATDGLSVVGLALLLAGLTLLHVYQQRLLRRELTARVQERTEELALVNSRLLYAERIAHLGHWERDLVTTEGFWSAENFRIYGLPPAPQAPGYDSFLACIHPGDREAVRRMREAVRTGSDPYDLRYRIVRPDGSIRHVNSQAEVERGADGQPRRLIGVTLDITDLVDAEERLRENEEKYRSVFEVARDGICLIDLGSQTILEANRAARRIYGYSAEEMHGLSIVDLSAEPDRTREALRAGLPMVPLRRHRRKDGTEIYVEVMSARARLGPGAVLVMAIRDITGRVAAEHELAESHSALLAVINATEHDMVGLINLDGTVRVANNKVAEVAGKPLSDIIGRRLEEFSPGDAAAQRMALVNQVLATGKSVHLEEVQGEQVFDTHCAPALGPDGLPIGVAVFSRNITARKQIENHLRKLNRAIEQAPLSVVITGLDGTIEYVNPHFTVATGYTAAEVIGGNPNLLKSGYSTERDYQAMWQTISGGDVWHGEFHNRRRDGELFWERASIAPVRDDHGAITHYVAVKEDITERKQAERDLLAAKERAEAANVAKSQFLATISHELRTPLNAIIGFSDCMKEAVFGPLGDDRYQRFAGSIHQAGGHLLRMINDIIDLAHAEAGTFQLAETIVDPRLEVISAAEQVQEAAAAAKLSLETTVPGHLPLLYADGRAIRTIVGNLLSNAVKFTPPGGRVAVKAWLEDSGLFALSVTDTGIGIPADQLAHVLKPFGQLDSAFSREHEGTGLGLPLCRSIAEMHGGHLEIESTPGVGTSVTVRFPQARVLLPGEELAALAPGLTG